MVYYGGVLVANSDLYHHGILGQKWGRRNGPPYPLRAGAHSVSEKKAGYQKSINGSGGSYSGIFKKKKKKVSDLSSKGQEKWMDIEKKIEAIDTKYDELERKTLKNKKGKEYDAQQKKLDDARNKEIFELEKQKDSLYGNAKEDRKKAKIEKRVREHLAEIKKNNPEQYEKIKKDTIDKGKASEIKYFVDDMNNNELQYVIDRLDKKAKINSLSNRETKTNWDKVKDISDKMKIVADFTNNAANIYNNLSRLAPTEDQNKKK